MPTDVYILQCPACGAGNRIPTDKEGRKGACGSCKTPLPLLYFQPQQLNDRTFDAFVNRYGEPVLVEFWAPG